MQTFYAPKENFTETSVTINGEEHHHATRSCHVRKGEIIGVFDGCGKHVHATIDNIDKKSLTAIIERDVSGAGEPDVEIIIALSVIKPSRFEIAVEKCTEIGVRTFVPVISERCAPNNARRLRIERLQKIALEAAKQSKRSWIPEIVPPVALGDFLTRTDGTILVASQNAEKKLENVFDSIKDIMKITLLIGPEGDFTDREYDLMFEAGAIPFSMGGLILRSETAGIVAASSIVSIFASDR
ncbi:RsmE family RNA methyltransferase [Candidatus Latescibacterota bacterium]